MPKKREYPLLCRECGEPVRVPEYEKHFFWTNENTVLTIAQITDHKTGAHRYIHWPRERFCWFKDERIAAS